MCVSSQVKSSQVKMPVAAAAAPAALGTLPRPRAARARAGALALLGARSGGASGHPPHLPALSELVEILHIALSCCASARSTHHAQHHEERGSWASTNEHSDALPRRPPRAGCFRALPARALLSILNKQSLGNKNGFSSLLAASPTGSNSISECTSKNLAFPSTPVATTCLSPTVLDRHSRTLKHADLAVGAPCLKV